MIGINNPLNVRSSSARWIGQTGSRKGFVCFDSVEHGVRAAMYLIFRTYSLKYQLYSYYELINRYAPLTENDTEKYVDFVCGSMRVDPADTPFECESLRNMLMPQMIYYMSIFEGNKVPLIECCRIFDKYKKDFLL